MKIIKFHKKKFNLHNNGKLSIFFIGTGSAFAKTMFQNNILIVKGNEHLLIDCGTRCMASLNKVGIHATDLDNILITHTHADHIGGLEEIMLSNRYISNKKPLIVVNEEFENILWEQSLRGGTAYSEIHNGEPLGFGDFWNILRPELIEDMPRETWGFQLSDLDIKMPRTLHIPDNAQSWKDSFWSCALILDERILFTSDTQYDPDLILEFDAIYDFELIFHDCQFFTGGVHASLDELMNLPDDIKAKTILMHYGDSWRLELKKMRNAGFKGFARQFCSYVFD